MGKKGLILETKVDEALMAKQIFSAAADRVPLQIDVWSDISCPWCFVGKVRLDKAIKNVEARAGTSNLVVVKWHPYIIDLKTNPAGEDYLAYNQRRWGSDSWTNSLRRSGAKDGATFGNWKWWPNSLNGHRLVNLAEMVGKAAEAKHALFTATYEDGKNVSDMDVLCSLAEELGLPDARQYLTSERGKQDVLEQDKIAKQTMDIDSVPYFVFNKKVAVSGARDVQYLEATIEKMLKG